MRFLTEKVRKFCDWAEKRKTKKIINDQDYLDRVVGPAISKEFLIGSRGLITVHSEFVKLPLEEEVIDNAPSFVAEVGGRHYPKSDDVIQEWQYQPRSKLTDPKLEERTWVVKAWRDFINKVFSK